MDKGIFKRRKVVDVNMFDTISKIQSKYSFMDIISILHNFNMAILGDYKLFNSIDKFLSIYFPELLFYNISPPRKLAILQEVRNRKMLSKYVDYKDSLGMKFDRKLEVFFFDLFLKIDEENGKIVDDYKKDVLNKLDFYLSQHLSNYAPNFTRLVGVSVAAKMLVLKNGLYDLSRLTSAKIQILGAEKALARFKKSGRASPKYGYIFYADALKSVDAKDKGRIAREFASKLSIALKIDFFRGKYDKEFIESILDKFDGLLK
jgi:hypothetical protein